MATALSEEELDNEDYYSLLNVRREASSEELKAAYRRLCMLYHPDKHRDPELKSQAERLFNLVHQAYEVLSDPQTRAIYDIYGKRGLEMEGWEVVERKRTPAEIREEFERLQTEREERRLQQRTNPKVASTASEDLGKPVIPERCSEGWQLGPQQGQCSDAVVGDSQRALRPVLQLCSQQLSTRQGSPVPRRLGGHSYLACTRWGLCLYHRRHCCREPSSLDWSPHTVVTI